MSETFSVTVYCGSRKGDLPAFAQAARDLGAALAGRGWRLVYGGGSIGLMGELARAALDAGGTVTGVITEDIARLEPPEPHVSDMHVAENLGQRKGMLLNEGDVLVALPGGLGTIDEVVDTMTKTQLRMHDKQLYLLDIDGYWQPFLGMVAQVTDHGFFHNNNGQLFKVVPSVRVLMEEMEKLAAQKAQVVSAS